MGAEYDPAVDMWTDHNFPGKLQGLPGSELSIVIHKTACNGECSAVSVANWFRNPSSGVSAHFIIDRDGTVVQCVHLSDGAWGNCCLENGHDGYWDSFSNKYGNLNFCTISIEHVDWTNDNSQPMTAEQINASFALVLWLVRRYNIAPTHIKGHNSLDPVSRARCPGSTYPMAILIQHVEDNLNPSTPSQGAIDAGLSIFTAVIKLNTHTGIFDMWMSDYTHGIFHGPALTGELPYTNWNGDKGVVQIFAGGQYEWINGIGSFYPYQ